MANLTVSRISRTGITPPTPVSADAGGDDVPNDGKTYIEVANGGGGSINVTANAVRACDQGFDHDVVVAVPAGATRMIGPFPLAVFGNTVALTYSGVTSVTVAAIGLS